MPEASNARTHQRYQLLIADIDGTLVSGSPEISTELFDAVRGTVERGLRITLASGRNSAEVRWFLDRLELREPYIALGGAYVGSPDGTAIQYQALPPGCAQRILDVARRQSLSVLIEFPDEVLFEGETIHLRLMDQISASGVREIPRGSFKSEVPPGKMVVIGDEPGLLAVESRLAEWDTNLEYARSLPDFLDITRTAVNKGQALQVLAHSEGIPPEKIVAVGDGWNDRSMFEAAGFSIAMGNSSQRLKEHADLVAPPADEKGFLWVLEYVLSELNRDSSPD